jgi:glutaredoxin 3
MKKIVVYSTTYCGYCRSAKHLLEELELPYTEIDVTNDDQKRQWLYDVTGHRTVPQIFIDERPIGGYTELHELVKSGYFKK